MGNSIQGTRKVILPDGSVHQYEEPVTVAELMLEHPQQRVFEVEAALSKMAAMPADKMLEKNKVYLMVPMRKGRPVTLSSEEASRLLLKANCFIKSKSFVSSAEGFIPLLARIWQSGRDGGGSDKGQKEAGVKKKALVTFQSEEVKEDIFSEFLEGRPDYLSKQLSGKGWKPSLNTIKEKSINTKVRHWLL